MLVVTRFDVPSGQAAAFAARAEAALAAFAGQPGFRRGRVGRAADNPSVWALTTEWDGVGSYRRSLGSYEVKVQAVPLLADGRDEPSVFEVLRAVDGGTASARPSGRAVDAGAVGVGDASGPACSDV